MEERGDFVREELVGGCVYSCCDGRRIVRLGGRGAGGNIVFAILMPKVRYANHVCDLGGCECSQVGRSVALYTQPQATCLLCVECFVPC